MDTSQIETVNDNGPSSRDRRCRSNCYYNNVVLCDETTEYAIPSSLEELFKKEIPTSVEDAIVLALHILMCETGFITKLPDNEIPSLLNIWKDARGIYTLLYLHQANLSTTCHLVCFRVGNQLAVHGFASNKEKESTAVNTGIHLDDFVSMCPTEQSDPLLIYTQLRKLSQVFKDEISLPLLSVVSTHPGMFIADFMSLPPELKISILKFLDARSLVAISVVCRELNHLSNDVDLWERLYHQDFNHDARADQRGRSCCPDTAKSLYREQYLRKVTFERCQRGAAETRHRRMNAFLRPSLSTMYRSRCPVDFYQGLDGICVRDFNMLKGVGALTVDVAINRKMGNCPMGGLESVVQQEMRRLTVPS